VKSTALEQQKIQKKSSKDFAPCKNTKNKGMRMEFSLKAKNVETCWAYMVQKK